MRPTPRHLAPVLAAVLLAAACSDSTGPGPAPSVSVGRSAQAIELRNRDFQPLAYFAIEASLAARANWAPCTDPGPECLRLPARGAVTIPYAEIAGYESGAATALVYSWRVVPDGAGGYRVAGLTAQAVEL